MLPSAPSLEAAAASSADVQLPIGARMIGTSVPSRSQRRVLSMAFLRARTHEAGPREPSENTTVQNNGSNEMTQKQTEPLHAEPGSDPRENDATIATVAVAPTMYKSIAACPQRAYDPTHQEKGWQTGLLHSGAVRLERRLAPKGGMDGPPAVQSCDGSRPGPSSRTSTTRLFLKRNRTAITRGAVAAKPGSILAHVVPKSTYNLQHACCSRLPAAMAGIRRWSDADAQRTLHAGIAS